MESNNIILELEQQAQLKTSGRGGRMALEDLALSRYHEALDNGKTQKDAERIYFETFQSR